MNGWGTNTMVIDGPRPNNMITNKMWYIISSSIMLGIAMTLMIVACAIGIVFFEYVINKNK